MPINAAVCSMYIFHRQFMYSSKVFTVIDVSRIEKCRSTKTFRFTYPTDNWKHGSLLTGLHLANKYVSIKWKTQMASSFFIRMFTSQVSGSLLLLWLGNLFTENSNINDCVNDEQDSEFCHVCLKYCQMSWKLFCSASYNNLLSVPQR